MDKSKISVMALFRMAKQLCEKTGGIEVPFMIDNESVNAMVQTVGLPEDWSLPPLNRDKGGWIDVADAIPEKGCIAMGEGNETFIARSILVDAADGAVYSGTIIDFSGGPGGINLIEDVRMRRIIKWQPMPEVEDEKRVD